MYTGGSKDDTFRDRQNFSFRNQPNGPRIQSVMIPNDGSLFSSQSDTFLRSSSNESLSSKPTTLKLRIEYKGHSMPIDPLSTDPVSNLVEIAAELFPEKVRKLIVDKVPYLSSCGIYLPLNRHLDSLFLKDGDTITFKKKDKRSIPIEAIVLGKDEREYAVVSNNTTALGLIYLLGNGMDIDIEGVSVFSSKGKKYDHKDKINAKRNEIFEIKIDQDRRDGKSNTSGSSSSLFSGMIKRAKSIRYSQKVTKKIDDSPNQGEKPQGWKKQEKETIENFLSHRPTESDLKNRHILMDSSSNENHNLSMLLMNRPSESELKERNILIDYNPVPRKIVTVTADPNAVPPLKLNIVKQLLQFIENHIDVVGLFRVSGQLDVVTSLYDQTWNQSIQIPDGIDIHAVTSTLKMYLRKQTNPLMPFSLYEEFLTAEKMDEDEMKVKELGRIVKLMPDPNNAILKELIFVLSKVSVRKDINMMGPQNLGIVFGPTIMWNPNTNILDFSSTGYQSSLVKTLIEEYSKIWNEDVEVVNAPRPAPNTFKPPTNILTLKKAPVKYMNNSPKKSMIPNIQPIQRNNSEPTSPQNVILEKNNQMDMTPQNKNSETSRNIQRAESTPPPPPPDDDSDNVASSPREEDIKDIFLSPVSQEVAQRLLQRFDLDNQIRSLGIEESIQIIRNLLSQIKN